MKMNIKKRTKKEKETSVPFLSDKELKYVLDGQKKIDNQAP